MTQQVSSIVPCLWLNDQAEEAAEFYMRLFPRGRLRARSYYPSSRDNQSGRPRGSVCVVEFEVAGQRFTLLNGGPMFTPNPSISFFYVTDSVAEVDRICAGLLDGGKALMALGEYPWSRRYGWIQDRYGISFQVMVGTPLPGGAAMAPCLMFADALHGKAEEALTTYVRILGGAVESLARYGEGTPTAGTISHGRFQLAGQAMVAMDAHGRHGFTFNQGISLQILCADQAELDRRWASLSEGGERGPCGWLQDRFGLYWQVVPADMAEWIGAADRVASERAFLAVMEMEKLDIAAIRAAFAS